MNKLLIPFLITITSFIALAQDNNVVVEADTILADSIYYYEDEAQDDDYTAAADSSKIITRSFDEGKIQELRADDDLQYKEPPTVAESLWDRFMIWLSQFFQSLFSSAVNTNWGRVFLYVLGIVALVIIVMMILKVNAFKIFYSGQGTSTIPYTVLEENIHEIDFEREIQEAVAKHDYRRGVRLVFLYSLKLLSDKQLIHWEQGKTNHEYVEELKAVELKQGLNELSFYFDYAWYGNFSVSSELFAKVQRIFNDWKVNVK